MADLSCIDNAMLYNMNSTSPTEQSIHFLTAVATTSNNATKKINIEGITVALKASDIQPDISWDKIAGYL